MFNALIRPALTVAVLLLVVPLVSMVETITTSSPGPKYVGGAAALGLVAALLLILVPVGSRRPGLTMSVLGACGVVAFATAWIYGGLSQVLISLAGIVMFVLCLAAAVTKVDRMKDETVSHF